MKPNLCKKRVDCLLRNGHCLQCVNKVCVDFLSHAVFHQVHVISVVFLQRCTVSPCYRLADGGLCGLSYE